MWINVNLIELDVSVLIGWGIGQLLKEMGLDSLHVVCLKFIYFFWIGFWVEICFSITIILIIWVLRVWRKKVRV